LDNYWGTPNNSGQGRKFITSYSIIIGFYGLLIGSKIALPYPTGKSRDFLSGKTYVYVMRVIGLILVIFAIYFVENGIQLVIS
jgi:hypothetical protein